MLFRGLLKTAHIKGLMKTRWTVSTSQGLNFTEGNAPYVEILGEPSPWVRFKNDGHVITSLGMISSDGHIFNLPSAGKRPKFSDFDTQEKPLGYEVWRKVASEIIGDREEVHYTVIEAIYQNFKLQIWVNDDNPSVSYSLVKTNEEIKS